MVGFIQACLGHRYRAVAGSNPALPTNLTQKSFIYTISLGAYQILR
jgi:hypothetical protein